MYYAVTLTSDSLNVGGAVTWSNFVPYLAKFNNPWWSYSVFIMSNFGSGKKQAAAK